MGASVGAALRGRGHDVVWVREGRSEATADRADAAALRPRPNLAAGLAEADHVISVCPPDAALDQARQVMEAGFAGTYVDANAVSPETARAIAERVGERYVDAGLIGPPAWKAGSTRLYLAGARARDVAGWFDGSPLDVRVLEGSPVAASALKMCYAAFTKGSSALLLGVRALADQTGVTDALLAEWDLSLPGTRERSEGTARATGPKAWRFEGEMREIAASFEAAGLPGGFHAAAAELFRRLRALKDQQDADIALVIEQLLAADRDPPA
jgi:3-hydroxyisobutyrate dehydrogenase-like beta-hydroxyacid dehydrogenase